VKCTRCGDELSQTKRLVESTTKIKSISFIVAGFVSKKTGKQSCSTGGPHLIEKPSAAKMTSDDIWTALDQQAESSTPDDSTKKDRDV
jgi:hypothetical protein